MPQNVTPPESGNENYQIFVNLFNTSGSPEDPDSNAMNIKIMDTNGNTIVNTTAMSRTGVGNYTYTWVVPSTLNLGQYNAFFTYSENSVDLAKSARLLRSCNRQKSSTFLTHLRAA